MRKTIFLLLFSGLFLFVTQANAQELSKEEKKHWKKEVKKYKKNPAALKKLVESEKLLRTKYSGLQTQNAQMEDELNRLKSTSGDKDQQMSMLQQELEEANIQLQTNRALINQLSATQVDEFATGIVFKVQIGAYEERRLSDNLNTTETLDLEEKGDLQKIVVGQFRDYEKAKRLRDHLKAIGVKDAWIVSYKDGNRISIEEALSNF